MSDADHGDYVDRWSFTVDPSIPPPPPSGPVVSQISLGFWPPLGGPEVDVGVGTIKLGISAFLVLGPADVPPAKRVALLVDDAVVGESRTPDPSGPQYFSFNWDTTKIPDGPHTLNVRAYDDSGHSGTGPGWHVMVWNSPAPRPNVNLELGMSLQGIGGAGPQQGQVATMGIAVANNGNARASNVRLRLFPSLAAPPTFTTTSPDMKTVLVSVDPHEAKEVYVDFTIPKTIGPATAYVVLDDGDPGSINEIDNSIKDNSAKKEYTVVAASLPDLSALLEILPHNPASGSQATAAVEVYSSGKGSVVGKQVRVRFFPYLTSPPTYTTASPIADKTATMDAETGITVVQFQFTVAGIGSKTAYAVVDNGDPGAIDEVNDTIQDNTASRDYNVQ